MNEPAQTLCGGLVVRRAGGNEVQPSIFPHEYLVIDEEGRDLLLLTIDRSWIGDELALSQFMVQLNELRGRKVEGLSPVELVDREEDFAVVGHPALVVPTYGRSSRMGADAWTNLAHSVAQGLAALHGIGQVHGCLTPGLVGGRANEPSLLGYGILQACSTDAFYRAIRRAASQGMAIAPEICAGQLPSPASDTWAWATTMAGLALGVPDLATISSAIMDSREHPVFGKLHPIMRQCFSQSTGQRPRAGDQLLNELSRVVGHSGSAPVRKAPAKLVARPGKPQPPVTPQALAKIPEVEPDWQLGELTQGGAELLADAISVELEQGGRVLPGKRPPAAKVQEPTDLSDLAEPALADDFDGEGRAEASQALRLSDLLGATPAPGSGAGHANTSPRTTTHLPATSRPQASAHETPLVPVRPAAHPVLSVTAPAPPIESPREAPWQRNGSARRPDSPPVGARSSQAAPRKGGSRWLLSTLIIVLALGLLGAAAALVQFDETQLTEVAGRIRRIWLILEGAQDGGTPASNLDNTTGTASATGVGSGVSSSTNEAPPSKSSDKRKRGERAAAPPPPPPCPSGMVAVAAATCIDEAEFPGKGQLPRVSINYRQAQLLCERRGVRLCTVEEWQAACAGVVRGCNVATGADAVPDIRSGGESGSCRTPSGVFELVGNVGEWVTPGAILGGDVATSRSEATCWARWDAAAETTDRRVGFRCCADR